MLELLNRILKICLLSKGPEDLPHSPALLQITLILYFISGVLNLWPAMPLLGSLSVMLLDVIVLLSFSAVCLRAFNKRERFIQLLTALAAVGAVIQILAWPLLLYINGLASGDSIPAEASILILLILSWNLSVYAHIFKRAFETRMLSAFVLTIMYMIINITLRRLLFPELGA